MCWGRSVPLFRSPLTRQENASYMSCSLAVTDENVFISVVDHEMVLWEHVYPLVLLRAQLLHSSDMFLQDPEIITLLIIHL